MADLREFGFADWFSIFLRAIPAYFLATIVIVLPFVVIAGLLWFIMPMRP